MVNPCCSYDSWGSLHPSLRVRHTAGLATRASGDNSLWGLATADHFGLVHAITRVNHCEPVAGLTHLTLTLPFMDCNFASLATRYSMSAIPKVRLLM